MRRAVFMSLLWSSFAVASSNPTIHALNSVTAATDHNSPTIALGGIRYFSFQCLWVSLTGSINDTVKLQLSNDLGTTWTDKSGAVLTVSGASGNGSVSVTNATENLYRLVYTAGSVTGGTINCWVTGK